jgi:hypothetical protein
MFTLSLRRGCVNYLLPGLLATLVACTTGTGEMGTPVTETPDAATPAPADMAVTDGPVLPRITPIDPSSHYAVLTKGVTTVDAGPGAVSPLILSSPSAFPLIVDEGNRILCAAALVGQGKALACGHENYITATLANNQGTQMVINAIGWMSAKTTPVIGIDAALGTLKAALTAAGFQTQTVTPDDLANVDVYVNRTYGVYTEAQYTAIRAFVQRGGGLIAAGRGWSFTGSMTDYPGNKMLGGSGITITNQFNTTANTDAVTPTPPSMLLNATVGIDKLIDHAVGVATLSMSDLTIAAEAVERAASNLPLSDRAFYGLADMFFAKVMPPVITAAAPFKPASDPVGRVALSLQSRYAADLPASQITANGSCADFPGAMVAAVPRQSFSVTINGTYAGATAGMHTQMQAIRSGAAPAPTQLRGTRSRSRSQRRPSTRACGSRSVRTPTRCGTRRPGLVSPPSSVPTRSKPRRSPWPAPLAVRST